MNKILLITLLIMLGFNGCGYKANPYYQSVPKSDDNVEFKIKKANS